MPLLFPKSLGALFFLICKGKALCILLYAVLSAQCLEMTVHKFQPKIHGQIKSTVLSQSLYIGMKLYYASAAAAESLQ